MYSTHASVVSFTSSIALSASEYDKTNKNNIFRMIPEEILRADENEQGLLESFSLAMARYFDELKLYVDQFDNLRVTNYENKNESPDVMLPLLTRYFGWKVSEHYHDSNAMSFFLGDKVLHPNSGSLDTSLVEIRNQFWRRILNNLPYLIKTKGKRYNVDAYFNVIGLNKNLFGIKEYGYVRDSSVEDSYIHKDKPNALLGIGTSGTFSASFVKVPLFVSSSKTIYTIETTAQLPHVSSSFTSSLLTGSVWQMVDPDQVTGSFTLLWNVEALQSSTGSLILTGSDGQSFRTGQVYIFDGNLVHIAAGLNNTSKPFIDVRILDSDTISYSASFVGSTTFSGVFTGSKYDFIIGANSGTVYHQRPTQGYFGEVRYWDRALSASELNAHALDFQNIGTDDPTANSTLAGHWAMNENVSASSAGIISNVLDHSRRGLAGTGSQFPTSANSYKKFLMDYNYLSPSIDLKWTENKIRIRNTSELAIKDLAKDTNEVALEFNLVDSLNEDITKIFASFDIMNNVIGKPVNKYRDEYADLESYRRIYFERLSHSINFMNFFKLFRWFDKKLSDSIKQLLPARAKFVGGEQVVESHFLERNKYGYKYPIFRTPKTIQEGVMSGTRGFSAENQTTLEGIARSTYADSAVESGRKFSVTSVNLRDSESVVVPEGALSPQLVSLYSDGEERVDRQINAMLTHSVGILYEAVSNTGSLAKIYDLAVDSSGTILSVGNASGSSTWITRKSHLTASSTWTILDSFGAGAVDRYRSIYVCRNSDADNDRVFTGGVSTTSIVFRRSTNHGASYTAVFSLNSGTVATDVVGFANSGSTILAGVNLNSATKGWQIWKSDSSGDSATWSEMDSSGSAFVRGIDCQHKTEPMVLAVGTSTLKSGVIRRLSASAWSTVYESSLTLLEAFHDVAWGSGTLQEYAFAVGVSGSNRGLVKRTTDGGATWTTVDVFSASLPGNAVALTGTTARTIAITPDESIYVAGDLYASGSPRRRAMWVRASYDRGETWHTLEYFNLRDVAADLKDEPFSLLALPDNRVLLSYESENYGVSDGFEYGGHAFVREYRKTRGSAFARTKTSGDDQDDKNDPMLGVNFKNDYTRRQLATLERQNKDGYRSGSFVNRKLGNTFVTNTANSSLDQEHYFGDARKTMRLSLHGVMFDRDIVLVTGSAVNDIAVDSSGNLFACGYKTVSSGSAWRVWKSVDGGSAWSELAGADTNFGVPSQANGIAIDPRTDIVYVVGQFSSSVLGPTIWGVQKSSDHGTTWTDIDAYDGIVGDDSYGPTPQGTGSAGGETVALGAAIKVNREVPRSSQGWLGSLYVVGYRTSGSVRQAVVRSSHLSGANPQSWENPPPDGGSWYTRIPTGTFSAFTSVAVDSFAFQDAEVIFFAGYRSGSDGLDWYIDASGSEVEYSLDNATNNEDIVRHIAIPSSGNYWVVGTGVDNGWAVRHKAGAPLSLSDGLVTNVDELLNSDLFYGSIASAKNAACGIVVDGQQMIPFTSSQDLYGADEAAPYQTASFAVYVVGYLSSSGIASASWAVRKTTDHGTTWQTIDEYCPFSGNGPNIARRGAMRQGKLFVCGQASGSGMIIRYSDNGTEQFVLTGSRSVDHKELHVRWFDSTNVPLSNTGTLISSLFGLEIPTHRTPYTVFDENGIVRTYGTTQPFTGSVERKRNPKISFRVSASNVVFNANDFNVDFRDNNSSAWYYNGGSSNYGYKKLLDYGHFTEEADGWRKFESLLFSGSKQQEPFVSTFFEKAMWRVSASNGNYVFKDFRLEWDQPLTDEGVKYLKDLDNQNIENDTTFTKYEFIKSVDD
jgi:hypothetical protein